MKIEDPYLKYLIEEEIYLIPDPSEQQPSHNLQPLKEKVQDTEPEDDRPLLTFKGENLKQLILIFEHQHDQYLNQEQENLLKKILGAINYSLKDVGMINLHHYKKKPDLDQLLELGCNHLIGLGINPSTLSKDRNMISHQVFDRKNIKILLSYSLDELNQDKNKKISLWNNLKKMFPV